MAPNAKSRLKCFVDKTKRNLGVSSAKKTPELEVTPPVKTTRAGETLAGATVYLDKKKKTPGPRVPSKPRPREEEPTLSPSSDSRSSRSQLGIAPWNKRNSQDSLWSVSSSIRELLRGGTPMPSPNIEVRKQRDIGEPGQPNFIYSEAQRVKTPPLSKGTTPQGRQRGFFFDMSPFDKDEDDKKLRKKRQNTSTDQTPRQSDLLSPQSSLTPSSSQSAPKTHTPKPGDFPSPLYPRGKGLLFSDPPAIRHWWDVKPDSDSPEGSEERPPRFMLNIPEHLPSSPLCPMNPKHKSGGLGVCVYHGRRRTPKKDADEYDSHDG